MPALDESPRGRVPEWPDVLRPPGRGLGPLLAAPLALVSTALLLWVLPTVWWLLLILIGWNWRF